MKTIVILLISLLIITTIPYAAFQQVNGLKSNKLPVIITPSRIVSDAPAFYFISGDGGWNRFDYSISNLLANAGIRVIGLDAKKFFWKPKSPEETTSAMEDLIETCTGKSEFVIAGYSFGAGIVPFVINRMKPDLRNNLRHIILLSPDEYGDFEIHLTDMLNVGLSRRRYNIPLEVKNITRVPVTCIFGDKEDKINSKAFGDTGSGLIILKGDHHYDDNYQMVADTLLKIILGKRH